MGTDLTVAIMTYNNPDRLLDCLRTLTKYAIHNYNIVVLDNSDIDTCQSYVDDVCGSIKIKSISVLHFGKNLDLRDCKGDFSKRINSVLLKAETEYICWMHDDVIFPPVSTFFWSRLIRVALDKRVGLVGPSINNGEGFQNVLRSDLPEIVKTHSIHVPLYLTRSDFFRDMGGLDETLHYSEVDFCIRTRLSGHDIVVHRGAYLHHVGGDTLRKNFGNEIQFQVWIRDLMQDTHNEMIRRHGVKVYADFLKAAHDKESLGLFYGEYDWSVQLKEAMEFKIERWIP